MGLGLPQLSSRIGFLDARLCGGPRLENKPIARFLLLVVAQVAAMLCHAMGGLLLPVLVAADAIGELVERRAVFAATDRWRAVRQAARILPVSRSVPSVAVAALVLRWKLGATSTGQSATMWDWHDKLSFVGEVLRDQNVWLDRLCAIGAFFLLPFGTPLGARWRPRAAALLVAVLLLYALLPARIGGSQAIDTRFLPVAAMLGLGLQDWSHARPRTVRLIAAAGAVLLAMRLIAITIGFWSYSSAYRTELAALSQVARGSRVFALVERRCGDEGWRMSRLDMLPALASPIRERGSTRSGRFPAWTCCSRAITGESRAFTAVFVGMGRELRSRRPTRAGDCLAYGAL